MAMSSPKLTQRRLSPEFMDDPAIPRTVLARHLRFIRAVNRYLGGAGAALRYLRRWSQALPRDHVIRILDVATGSADIPLAMVKWARRAGRTVHITAIDRHPTTLALAAEHIGARSEIQLLPCDALRLDEQFPDGSFDFAHAGMFLHHLRDQDAITVLASMNRLSRRGLIWNDLVRSRSALLGAQLLTIGLPAELKHDAVVSVEAGFTRTEALALARAAGLREPRHRHHLFGRFTLTNTRD